MFKSHCCYLQRKDFGGAEKRSQMAGRFLQWPGKQLVAAGTEVDLKEVK